MATCKGCGKEFESQNSMEQHYNAKHAKPKPVPKPSKGSGKKRWAVAAIVVLAVAGYFVFASGSDDKPVYSADLSGINLDEVPRGPIHWHPVVRIIINGEERRIPANIGASSNVHSPGSIMMPIHTHDDSGTLHMESSRPTAETVTLGYFFNAVWRRTFNSTCIFEYCSGPGGNLTMTVNGQPNDQLHNYIPKDGEDIVIRYG